MLFADILLPKLTYKNKNEAKAVSAICFFTKCAAFHTGKAHPMQRKELDSRIFFTHFETGFWRNKVNLVNTLYSNVK